MKGVPRPRFEIMGTSKWTFRLARSITSAGPPPKLPNGGIPETGGFGGGALPEAPVTVNQREFVVTDPAVTVTDTAPTAKLGTTAEMLPEVQLLTTAVEPPKLTVPLPCVDPKSAPVITTT